METKTIVSKQWTLQARDWLRGFIMAVATPCLYLLQELIPGWNLDPFVQAGLSAGVAYILKNLVEPTKTIEIKK